MLVERGKHGGIALANGGEIGLGEEIHGGAGLPDMGAWGGRNAASRQARRATAGCN